METLVRAGLNNALVAALLAGLVLLISRFCRRPAVLHALWLLVLLKLITPPLIWLPLPWPTSTPSGEELAANPVGSGGEDICYVRVSTAPQDMVDALEAHIQLLNEQLAHQEASFAVFFATSANRIWLDRASWFAALVWLLGTACWFAVAFWRLWRFGTLLRHAVPANEELNATTRRLADRLGLRSHPTVSLVPGKLAPMLWMAGGPSRLILPAHLVQQLSAQQQETLIIHELAHWKRGDHRVRWLELLVRGLYWWHPLVWYACRELREAEEQCCDAWVVSALPGSERTYALALMETLDFLAGAQSTLPAVASGIGQVTDLKRRLTMIMRGTTPRSLTWLGRISFLTLSVVFLSLSPTWAQQEVEIKTVEEALKQALKTQGIFQGDGIRIEVQTAKGDEKPKVVDEAARLKAELQRKRDELAALEAKLAQLKKAVQAKQEPAKKLGQTFEFKIDGLTIVEDGKAAPKKPTQGIVLQFEGNALDGLFVGGGKAAPKKPREILLREVDGKWIVVNNPESPPATKSPTKGKAGKPENMTIILQADGKEMNLPLFLFGEGKGGKMEWKIVPSGEGKDKKTPKPNPQPEKKGVGSFLIELAPPGAPGLAPQGSPPTAPPGGPPGAPPRSRPLIPGGPTPAAPVASDERLEKLEQRLKELEALLQKMKEKDKK